MIQRVGIVSKPSQFDIPPIVAKLAEWLDQRRVRTELDEVTAGYLNRAGGFSRDSPPEGLDLMIVLLIGIGLAAYDIWDQLFRPSPTRRSGT